MESLCCTRKTNITSDVNVMILQLKKQMLGWGNKYETLHQIPVHLSRLNLNRRVQLMNLIFLPDGKKEVRQMLILGVKKPNNKKNKETCV